MIREVNDKIVSSNSAGKFRRSKNNYLKEDRVSK